MAINFGSESTTDEVLAGVSLKGKRILITGVSSGLGVETARALAAHGADVVGAARDLTKARNATREVQLAATLGGGSLELVELDLASLKSVRCCADELLADGRLFDIIIANAGIMACPKGVTQDGFETQFGTNHLGHFLLINRIVSLLIPGGRLVNISSSGHNFSDIDIDDLNFERTPYDEWQAYGASKTAGILFAVEFDRRYKKNGIRAVAVHPGSIKTELSRHLTLVATGKLVAVIEEVQKANDGALFIYKSVSQGAATSVWAAVIAKAHDIGGRYCEDCHVAEIQDDARVWKGVRRYAVDQEHAKALWKKSEELVGESF